MFKKNLSSQPDVIKVEGEEIAIICVSSSTLSGHWPVRLHCYRCQFPSCQWRHSGHWWRQETGVSQVAVRGGQATSQGGTGHLVAGEKLKIRQGAFCMKLGKGQGVVGSGEWFTSWGSQLER